MELPSQTGSVLEWVLLLVTATVRAKDLDLGSEPELPSAPEGVLGSASALPWIRMSGPQLERQLGQQSATLLEMEPGCTSELRPVLLWVLLLEPVKLSVSATAKAAPRKAEAGVAAAAARPRKAAGAEAAVESWTRSQLKGYSTQKTRRA